MIPAVRRVCRLAACPVWSRRECRVRAGREGIETRVASLRHAESVRNIELAAAPQFIGSYWTHLGVTKVSGDAADLDFAYPGATVRPDVPANRRLLEAVERGHELRCVAP